jgi:hypothetical protein
MFTRPLNVQQLLEAREERSGARRAAGLGRPEARL